MSWQHGTEALFDSDEDQGNKDQGLALRGEYDRGSTPPSNHASPSPVPPASPDIIDQTQKSNPASAGYSRSSTSGNYTAESDTMSHKKDYDDYSPSRSRSRSTYSRSRSRSPSYSDSFDSEDSMQDSRRASPVRNKKTTRGRSNTTNNRYNSGSSKDSRMTHRTVRSSNYGSSLTPRQPKKGAAKKKLGAGRSQSVSGSLQESPRTKDVSKRMLSAKGHTISRLRNEVDDFRRKYEEASRENKLLVQLQRRQEAALAKYENKEEELPQMLRQHSAELENLRERLRRTQDRDKDKDRRIRNKNEEINKLNDEVTRLRRLAEDKSLLDRDKLQRKVDKLQDALDEKERRVEDLEKYSENLKKNERFGGDQWKVREKEYRGRIARLEDENRTLHLQLKEKEKELDIRNIYSNRPVKHPVKLNTTISSSPARPFSETRATSNDDLGQKPPPGPSLKRSSSVEEKPRENIKPSPKPKEEKKVEVVERAAEEKKEPKRELSEHEKILMDLDSGFKPQAPPKRDRNDDVLTDLDKEIKRREREDEERRKREKEEAERRKKKEMEEEGRRQREEERRRREEEERKRKEEEERKEKERRQKEEEERRRDEEDFAAQRRKQKEDAEKLAEERKKKDLLLAKMRELDGKPDSRGGKKDYKFTQPVENLHHGKPSHPDLLGSPTVTRKKPAADNDPAFGSYAPSFGRRAAAGDKPPAKKGGLFDDDVGDDEDIFAPKPKQNDNSTKLRSNLFGETKTNSPPSKSRNSLEGTVFSNSTKAKPVADSNLLPWEKKTPANPFAFTPSHPNKSNGVTVKMPKSSFDDFDDDIEEVVL